jgi:parallel beta-helix repeat protein
VGINIGKPNAPAPNATHVFIDGNTIQYTVKSCAYWPATGYGACPDVTCAAATCHDDAIHIWGIQNSTISNNRIVNADVQGIFIEDAAGAVNTNMSILHNAIQVVGGGVAMNLKGVAGMWTVAFNSTPNSLITGFGFLAATPGTVVQFAANDGILLIADSTGNNAGCSSAAANVSLVYRQNTWLTPGGATSTGRCTSTDLEQGRVRYGGLGAKIPSFNAQNLHGLSPPPPGLGYYTIDGTHAGRVTAYHFELNAQPGFGIRERLDLLVRKNLPNDIVAIDSPGSRCAVWRSQKLKRLVGLRFAVARADPGRTTAGIRAQATPQC